jgi:hypothetical protein
VVTDEPLDVDAQQFGLEDVKGAADLIESQYILPNRQRIALYINGKKVELKVNSSETLQKILAALAPDLKETNLSSLDLRYQNNQPAK